MFLAFFTYDLNAAIHSFLLGVGDSGYVGIYVCTAQIKSGNKARKIGLIGSISKLVSGFSRFLLLLSAQYLCKRISLNLFIRVSGQFEVSFRPVYRI